MHRACGAIAASLVLLSSCSKDTEGLEPRRTDSGAQQRPADAEPADAAPPDVDLPDVPHGVFCDTADDCPGPASTCDGAAFCTCGISKSCRDGRCVYLNAACVDGGEDTGAPADAGARDAAAPDAAAPDDAGASGGSCTSHAGECTGTGRAVGLCSAVGAAAAWSCLDERCIWACSAPVTCDSRSPGMCLACGAAPVRCPERPPCLGEPATGWIEEATCPSFPLTMVPFEGSTVTLVRTSTLACAYGAYLTGGVAPLGRIAFLEDGRLLADVPGFGGACLGEYAPTGALRIIWSCPECMFVMRL